VRREPRQPQARDSGHKSAPGADSLQPRRSHSGYARRPSGSGGVTAREWRRAGTDSSLWRCARSLLIHTALAGLPWQQRCYLAWRRCSARSRPLPQQQARLSRWGEPTAAITQQQQAVDRANTRSGEVVALLGGRSGHGGVPASRLRVDRHSETTAWSVAGTRDGRVTSEQSRRRVVRGRGPIGAGGR